MLLQGFDLRGLITNSLVCAVPLSRRLVTAFLDLDCDTRKPLVRRCSSALGLLLGGHDLVLDLASAQLYGTCERPGDGLPLRREPLVLFTLTLLLL